MANPDDELRCCVCEYSLAGVAHAAACPECGTPIERSRRRAELAAAMIPRPTATARCLAGQAAVEAVLVVVVVAMPFVYRAMTLNSPMEWRVSSLLYFGWLGLWAASMALGALAAWTLTRGDARRIALAAAFVCAVGLITLSVAAAMALWSGEGFMWAATDAARVTTKAASLTWSLATILMCVLSVRAMHALSERRRTWFRAICFGVFAAHAACLAADLARWFGASELPAFFLSGLIWTVGLVLSSLRGWLLFVAIRRWTVRASRPPSVATPPAG